MNSSPTPIIPQPQPQPQLVAIKPETQTKRPRKTTSMDTQCLYEIIDLENDNHNGRQNDITIVSGPKRRRPRFGSTKADAISVETYANDRDLQAAMAASLAGDLFQTLVHIDDDDDDGDDEDLQILWFKAPVKFSGPSVNEIGESSSSSSKPKPKPRLFDCEICAEAKPRAESFSVHGCDHRYCTDCTAKYVASRLGENVTAIACPEPGCAGSLEPERCRGILPGEVFERWGLALCEAAIMRSGRVVYCPYKECSAPMFDDGGEGEAAAVVVEAECPSCNRMFCARCEAAWHVGMGCEEFQRLGKDEREAEDLMLMKLASKKHWKRCPRCKFYVERSEGCLYMKCRCGIAFCYNCGSVYKTHNSHYCSKCKR